MEAALDSKQPSELTLERFRTDLPVARQAERNRTVVPHRAWRGFSKFSTQVFLVPKPRTSVDRKDCLVTSVIFGRYRFTPYYRNG